MRELVNLPNGCSRSAVSVTPKNWKTQKASVKKNWKINYRFYDPAYKSNPKLWGRQITVRGMNDERELEKRQKATKALIDKVKDLIDVQLYNPITCTYMAVQENVEEITPHTYFLPALWKAYTMVTGAHGMLIDIKSAINHMQAAAGKLFDKAHQMPYNALRIHQVSRKHLLYILKQCGKDNPRFSANRYNKYRDYLVILFKRLLAVEAVDGNPALTLPIEKHTPAKRKLLNAGERAVIDNNLRAADYYFWRYTRIFHRSGSRTTELLQLKNNDHIDLINQEFTILVKKGQEFKWDTRPIPDDILPLWQEVINEAQAGDYLFGRLFKPGPKTIRPDNVNRRWNKHVKIGMGIKKEFYPLKHHNADSIDEQLNIEHAAAADGHTDTKTTKKHYAVNHKQRMIDKLKKTKVDF